MAEIVNLNKFRKQRERDAARQTADENRVTYGRSKVERGKSRAEAEKAAKDLDGKQID
jgi:hypothetical protein